MGTQAKKYLRIGFIVAVTFLAVFFLFRFLKQPLFTIAIFDKNIINFYLSYEFSTLLVSLALLVLLYFTANRIRLSYFNLKRIDAPMEPAKFAGIKPGERWKTTGLTITIIITVVTAVVVYFQVARNGIQVRLFPDILLVFLFALMNSFTEEVIFRLSYATIVANEGLSPRISEFLGTVVFGAVHYFGKAPSGIPGTLMAAFIGWFLTKSINETKGFFWAWLVHFLQDVVILFLLFSTRT